MYMAENKTIKDKDMPCKHKNHTSLKHIGLKLACHDSLCKRPLTATWHQENRTLKQSNQPSITASIPLTWHVGQTIYLHKHRALGQ